MNRARCCFRVHLVIALLLLFAAAPVLAWENDLDLNDLICSHNRDTRSPTILSDNLGGYYVVWIDERTTGLEQLFAQRLDAEGNWLWAEDGVSVFATSGTIHNQFFAAAVDGDGMLFLGIVAGGSNTRAYVQMVASDGKLPWLNVNGREVTPGTPGSQDSIRIVTDGYGGVIAGFTDTRNLTAKGVDIYAQRLDRAGYRQWAYAGMPVCTEIRDQNRLQVVSVEMDKAMFFWVDDRNHAVTGQDIYGEALGADGVGQWSATAPGGIPICDHAGDQYLVSAVSDGFLGAILSWQDERDGGGNDYDVYAQRIHPSGTLYWSQWEGDGVPICRDTSMQFGGLIAPDGAGGACIIWEDHRFIPDTIKVMGQYISSAGYTMWATDGIPIFNTVVAMYWPEKFIVQDGQDGWLLLSMNYPYPLAQRVGRDGSLSWDPTGMPLTTGGILAGYTSVVADGRGGMIGVWVDRRLAVSDAVYAQRLDRWGQPGDAGPGLYEVIDRPGDQGGEAIVSWTASYLDTYSDPEIDHYSVWMQYVGSAKQAVDLSDRAISNLAKRVGLNTTDALTLAKSGWALAGQLDAYQFEGYAFHAPTYGDSTGAVTPLTNYKVLAHGGNGIAYWESGEMTGWSVDNLSPGAPLALLAARDQADVDLVWTPSNKNDEDLAEYLVYRSDGAQFTPGPTTFIGTAPDIEYHDATAPASTLYYRVIGRDLHGNESPPSNVAMVSGLSAVGDPAPRVFAVHDAFPNPFNPQTTIAFDLPSEQAVSLLVYDLGGRLVDTLLHDEVAAAGRNEIVWRGRDLDGRVAPAGVYFYRLEAVGYSETKRVVLVK